MKSLVNRRFSYIGSRYKKINSYLSEEKLINIYPIDYDFINDLMSFGLHKKIKEESIKRLNIKPNSIVLDLCCGTGDLAKIIKQKHSDSTVIGVDFSSKMLELAKEKVKDVEFIEMNVQNMSFSDNYFDCVVCSFGLRNVEHIDKALYEIHRVLKPEGKFLHLDFGNKNIF